MYFEAIGLFLVLLGSDLDHVPVLFYVLVWAIVASLAMTLFIGAYEALSAIRSLFRRFATR